MAFKNITLDRALPYILLISGIIGYAAALIIMVEKLHILEQPGYLPSCSLNPVLSCGSVMTSDQSDVFGFPNPFIGLGAFPVLAVIGGAILAGARFKRWFWLGLQAGMLFALGFVHWLFFQSTYRIGAICLYCVAVWIVTITSFWYVSLYNIDKKHIRLPQGRATQIYGWIRRHHLDILIVWLLLIAGLILQHFWYYFGRNF